MAGKYKARITKKQFNEFMEYCNKDKKMVKEMVIEIGKLFGCYGDIYKKAEEMFGMHIGSMEERKHTFSLKSRSNMNLKTLVDYLADNDLSWRVLQKKDCFLHLNFSGHDMLWLEEFCTLEELSDYDGFSMSEIRSRIGESGMGISLPAEIGNASIRDLNEKKSRMEEKEKTLNKMMEDVNQAKIKELAKMEQEIQKMQDALRQRKQELMSELNEKMNVMQEEMDKIQKQIHIMESEIYAIRSYSGETVELKKIRSGRKAKSDTPLTINQRIMYLDEDFARIVSVYQDEIAEKYQMFADAVAASDEAFESFCPQDRCLTFFRLSRNATYEFYNGKSHMYETEQLIHGKKMGFLLRDMDCAYIGWLDESWNTGFDGEPVPVTFEENLMYEPKTAAIHEISDSGDKEFKDDQNSMLSRLFAMAVVQGIIDNKGILDFPEKVSVTNPGPYIVYNFATAWIMDDRFGDFATLADNLNKRTKVKDQILVCKNKTYGLQGRGEADRTYDCEVPRGVHRVNYLESDSHGRCAVYVSAIKRFSTKGAAANVLCNPREYINITYMNSIWMNYYIQTKKLGDYVVDYAEMVKHLKSAVEVISVREHAEMEKIKLHYPDADKIPEWQILLSHWKLNHGIRFINNYQAKRIASYLKSGNYEENAHLFEHEDYFDDIDETNQGAYSHTVFSWRRVYRKKGTGKFANGSDYHRQRFYLEDYGNSDVWTEERKKDQEERNACVVAKGMPALEALVPERIVLDEEKLSHVSAYVSEFISSHGISAEDLKSVSQHSGIVYGSDGKIGFVTTGMLTAEEKDSFFKNAEGKYPIYILQSECWKIAYYDFIHWKYAEVLHEAKGILHGRHMHDTKKSQKC